MTFKVVCGQVRNDHPKENQSVLKLPVVRNGKSATVGYQPDVWKTWK